MFEIGEVDAFLGGQRGPVLELRHDQAKCAVRFESGGENRAIAFVPVCRETTSDEFDIEKALAAPLCAAEWEIVDCDYRIRIDQRSQMFAVFKIACNHLGWFDFARISKRYLTAGQT